MTDEPFGRQPKPVKVVLSGDDAQDVLYWTRRLYRFAEHNGADIQLGNGHHTTTSSTKEFTIYPRAVND